MYIIFDIETVRQFKELKDAPDQYRKSWTAVSMKKWPDDNAHETYLEHSQFYPEFGKIICISVKREDAEPRSFSSCKDVTEAELLNEFNDALTKISMGRVITLVGHAIKYFDLPWINVRMAANGIKLNPHLKTYGVKPWDLKVIDTKEVWKGGLYSTSQSASLDSVCLALGVDTPKDEISGADVGRIFWDEDDIEPIVHYCEKDVTSNWKVLAKMIQLNMI